MSVEGRKRFRLVSALTWLALAAPVAAGGYIVYQKYVALADGGARAGAQAKPPAPERVWIVANDDDEQAPIRPSRRSDTSPGGAQAAGADVDQPLRKRVISLGPSARPEQRPAPVAALAPAPPAPSGPRFYQLVPDASAPGGPVDARRRRGVVAESDPTQVSGSSLSAGPGQITSGPNP
jgi:hypothetical protein